MFSSPPPPGAYRLPMVRDPVNGSRCDVSLEEHTLNLTRKELVTPVTFMILLHLWVFLARLVVANRGSNFS